MNAATSDTGKKTKTAAKPKTSAKKPATKKTTKSDGKTAAKTAAGSRSKTPAKTAAKTAAGTASGSRRRSAARTPTAKSRAAQTAAVETAVATPPPAAAPTAEPPLFELTQPRAASAPGSAMETATRESMEKLLERQRRAFLAEGAPPLGVRIDRLERCISLVVNHYKRIVEALDHDFSGRAPQLSMMSDVLDSLTQLKHTRKHLRRWMRPERRSPGLLPWLFGARASIRHQPKGVVGVMAPWNFPVNMIFNPLSNILGAGNRAMVKPSEYNPATAQLIAELFPRYFEPTEIAVCNGGPEVGAIFSSLPFDHLIFTGGTEIGRKVLGAAAPNLTPVTLELGGKSPVIIGRSADLQKAAQRIVAGKTMNSGQACISPDYVFAPRESVDEFAGYVRENFRLMYPRISGNPDYTSVISEKHVQRLNSWLEEAQQRGSRVMELQSNGADDGGRRLPLRLVLEPAEDAMIMQHELFGPVMAVRGYDEVDKVIDFINARPRPLALYYFGKDRKEERRILDRTCSGGVTINDVMMHASCSDLPFGGVGDSGMGNYHGIDGFRTFSHARATLRQGPVNLAQLFKMLPPYNDKVIPRLRGQIRE